MRGRAGFSEGDAARPTTASHLRARAPKSIPVKVTWPLQLAHRANSGWGRCSTAPDWPWPSWYAAIRLRDRMLFDQLHRRAFIALLSGATAAWPLVASW